jgi:hypothetical protein
MNHKGPAFLPKKLAADTHNCFSELRRVFSLFQITQMYEESRKKSVHVLHSTIASLSLVNDFLIDVSFLIFFPWQRTGKCPIPNNK